MVPMKILFLAHRIPYPPNKGEKIRAFHELRYLAERHTIDLFCLADSPEEAAQQRGLQCVCRRVHVETRSPVHAMIYAARSFLRKEPLSSAFFYSPKLRAAVLRALADEKYDLILVYCSSMAQYVPQPAPAPVVIDFVDTDSAKWAQYAKVSAFPLSWLFAREARCMARYEKQCAAASSASVVATAQEAAALDGEGQFAVQVIENGVCLSPEATSDLPDEVLCLQPYVLFVGTMDYLVNVDAVTYFVGDILPRVQQTHPELRFVIAGRNPSRRVRRLARQPGVVVTGAISEVHSYLRGATAVVAPFRLSQGVHNKILEALAAGQPVVSTSRPAQAIGARHGETLLVADSPEEFARAVVSLVEDPMLRSRFRGAVELIRQRFDWQKNLKQLEELLERAAGLAQKIEIGASTSAEIG